MDISIFDLFSIGIGPSSSHTLGPMKAAKHFITNLTDVDRIEVELFGSLAHTGKGHHSDKAVLLGLLGYLPETIDPDIVDSSVESIYTTKSIKVDNRIDIAFDPQEDLIFNFKDLLPKHSNGMRFKAFLQQKLLSDQVYYSIGGGFIVTEEEYGIKINDLSPATYHFESGAELLKLCEQHNKSIAEIMLANESAWHTESEVKERLLYIDRVMEQCIQRGCQTRGVLPGGLNVTRRAAEIYQRLNSKGKPTSAEHTDSIDWLNMYALAVNEENAAGGRVVTAPTNGAAGIIPAVLNYYKHFHTDVTNENIIEFLLTAGAIATLFKKNASISGAEVGCQGEVGVAASMAAAGLTAVLGGTPLHIENAAEIAMEHHLGMTCDPMNGLVQIPCIERNAMGAIKAVNAARLSLLEGGDHKVSLDKVIATMHQTGKDMMTIYKETSRGGLAANLAEC